MSAQKAINLLPKELGVKSETTKVADILKKITIATIVVFLALGGVAAAYIIVLTTQTNASKARQEALMASIGTLEQTEQRLVLVRDRLAKIQPILDDQETTEGLAVLSNFVSGLPSGVSFVEAEVTADSIEASFTSTSSLALASLLSGVVINESFERVTLNSFSFNPSSGYLTVLGLTATQ